MKVALKRILRSEDEEESKIDKIHDLLLDLTPLERIRKWRSRYYNQKIVNDSLREKNEKLQNKIYEMELKEDRVQTFMERINKVSVDYIDGSSLKIE